MLNLLDANSEIKKVEPAQLIHTPYKERKAGWAVREPFRFINDTRIHPMQRKKIDTILKYLKNEPNIKKVIVFGSSVRTDCHVGSDVDIYVEMDEEKKLPEFWGVDFLYDLWTNFTVDDRMLKEITGKGVIVYERGRDIIKQGNMCI